MLSALLLSGRRRHHWELKHRRCGRHWPSASAGAEPARAHSGATVRVQCGNCAEVMDVEVPYAPGSRCQFQCFRCGVANEIPAGQPVQAPAPSFAGVPRHRQRPAAADGHAAATTSTGSLAHPAPAAPAPTLTPRLEAASDDERSAVQAMVEATWLGAESGGAGVEVVQVMKNSNPALWRLFCDARQEVGARSRGVPREAVLTDGFCTGGCCGDTASLFHGTGTSRIEAICQRGFTPGSAGTGAHRGDGFGFAENSSIADERAVDDQYGIYQGLLALLVCRVALGRSFTPGEAELSSPDTMASRHQGFHTVIRQRGSAGSCPREFTLLDGRCAYPEFVVLYRKLGNNEASQ
ncbi:unnamed protein product [Prorocentrum cordatum]|uniref:PARP catalytic domain-containing protein n=1 Tax=Prorocentrum cordatum TaxID=2364126 RepID=A0ABN9T7Z8_9DINO|nr:unnamed protein product [Polarella glacialis]